MSDTESAPNPASLTDSQAIRALHLLYELSPLGVWEGTGKPSPERLKTLAAGLAEEAPADLQPALTALLDENDPGGLSTRAALARVVLKQAGQSPAFAPAAAQAIEIAVKPEMFIDPITAGLVVSLVVAMSHIKVDVKRGRWEFETRLPEVIGSVRLSELTGKLPAILKALPQSIWDVICGKH